jgi:ribosome-binding protein aMBF1 (putative translation factor)
MLPLVGCRKLCLKVLLHIQVSIMSNKAEISIKFGKKVREIRTQKGLSQEQLAHDANVHRTYIGMIERAEKNITLVNIEKIAKALNIEIAELLK